MSQDLAISSFYNCCDRTRFYNWCDKWLDSVCFSSFFTLSYKYIKQTREDLDSSYDTHVS